MLQYESYSARATALLRPKRAKSEFSIYYLHALAGSENKTDLTILLGTQFWVGITAF